MQDFRLINLSNSSYFINKVCFFVNPKYNSSSRTFFHLFDLSIKKKLDKIKGIFLPFQKSIALPVLINPASPTSRVVVLVNTERMGGCQFQNIPAEVTRGYVRAFKTSSWGGEGAEGRHDGGDVTNVQCESNQNCHLESPQYNEHSLIKKFF
jgi:hypothetical protein